MLSELKMPLGVIIPPPIHWEWDFNSVHGTKVNTDSIGQSCEIAEFTTVMYTYD